jgi:RNA polymerase sigma-70 factor (ECF subfamily)
LLVIINVKQPAGEEGAKLVIDIEKLKKAEEGDPQAIEQLCLATWEPLYRFVYFKVQNREETEDITQETYLKTLTYWRDHPGFPDNILGFMKTIALNIIRDRWRQKKRRGIPVSFLEINPGETAAADQQNAIAQRLLVESALAKLSEDHRIILDLRIVKGYSAAETAKQVGKTEAAVRTAQHRALQALAALLDGDY